MFDQAVADFSKIDSEKRQFVSAAIHKAFIEVVFIFKLFLNFG